MRVSVDPALLRPECRRRHVRPGEPRRQQHGCRPLSMSLENGIMEPRQHGCRITSVTTSVDPAREAFFRSLVENPPFPRDSSLAEQRDIMDTLASMNPPLPEGVAIEQVRLATGARAELLTPPEAHPRRAIVYAHGGAFVNGRTPSVWHYRVYRIAAAAHASLLYVLYRLAPEHPFPAARDDVIAGHEYPTTMGFEPEQVVDAADSAGVNLR